MGQGRGSAVICGRELHFAHFGCARMRRYVSEQRLFRRYKDRGDNNSGRQSNAAVHAHSTVEQMDVGFSEEASGEGRKNDTARG